MTANATHPGRITIPGTGAAVPGTLIAEPQTENMVLTLSDRIALGPVKIDTDQDGNLYSPGLVVPIVSGVLWELRFEPHRHDIAPFSLGVFNLNTSGEDLRVLVPTVATAITETDRLNIAAAAALGATNDTATASFLNNDASATRAALTTNGKKPVGKGELVLNAADYGIVGDTTTQSLTSLNAAITAGAALGAVAVYFPAPSGAYYAFNQALPNVNNVRIVGDSMGAALRWTSGSMLAPTGTLQGWSFENIGLQNASGGGHLIDLTGTSGLIHSTFRRVEMKTLDTTTSILHMASGGNLFNLRFQDCKLWRQPTHTVPAIDVVCSSSGCNSISFVGGQWHSQGASTGPFARFETTAAGAYIAGLTFRDIVGEINMGGLIHCYGVTRCTVDNVIDFDSSGSYTDDLFKFDTAPTGTLRCHGLVFENSGTNGNATFAAGKQHLYLGDTGTSHRVGRVVQSAGSYGTTRLPATGRTVHHGGGPAWSSRTVTASLSVLSADHHVVGNGNSITITLPDPTVAGGVTPAGREFVVKNVHTSALTVASAGTATIDGATSKSLATNESARFISNGTNWLIVGAPVVRTATTTALTSATNAVNNANKTAGTQVFNTTTSKPVWATGALTTSTWVDATGTVAHTPV